MRWTPDPQEMIFWKCDGKSDPRSRGCDSTRGSKGVARRAYGNLAPLDPFATSSRRPKQLKTTKRTKLKWPKANVAKEWGETTHWPDPDTGGRVESKLKQMGDLIYQTCRPRFGKVTSSQRTTQRGKGRRDKEIENLVRRRWQIDNNWKKAKRPTVGDYS